MHLTPQKEWQRLGLVTLAYLFVGIVVTYPLIRVFTTHMYGLPGDGFATIWAFWWNMSHPIGWTAPAQPTLLAVANVLSSLFGEVSTYNLIILAGYPLSGVAIYLIVHHFTGDRVASFFAGLMYILGPYHIYQSYVHLSLAITAWLPFYLYVLLLWLKDPQYWRACISGLILALVILDNYYYGYLAILLTIFFVIGLLIQIRRKKLSFWTALLQGLIAGCIAGLIIAPFIVPAFSSGATEAFERPVREISVFRAQWWDFFMPPITHPLIGELIRQTTRYELNGSNFFERTLYLGYIPLFLAILGVMRNRRSWLTYFLLALFTVSLLLAVAPDGVGEFLHRWFPAFRVYSRFGLLSLMSICILAGLGIASFSHSMRTFIVRLGLIVLIIADFYPLFPAPVVDVTTQKPHEAALNTLPRGSTIVYPLATADDVPTNEYLSDPRHFAQPPLNAINTNYHFEPMRQRLLNPIDTQATALMHQLNIRYIVIRKDVYKEGRLPNSLWRFYGPDYPRLLPSWNGGNAPDLRTDPRFLLEYEDKQAALYSLNPSQ